MKKINSLSNKHHLTVSVGQNRSSWGCRCVWLEISAKVLISQFLAMRASSRGSLSVCITWCWLSQEIKMRER